MQCWRIQCRARWHCSVNYCSHIGCLSSCIDSRPFYINTLFYYIQVLRWPALKIVTTKDWIVWPQIKGIKAFHWLVCCVICLLTWTTCKWLPQATIPVSLLVIWCWPDLLTYNRSDNSLFIMDLTYHYILLRILSFSLPATENVNCEKRILWNSIWITSCGSWMFI